jgi:hypothetical protein
MPAPTFSRKYRLEALNSRLSTHPEQLRVVLVRTEPHVLSLPRRIARKFTKSRQRQRQIAWRKRLCDSKKIKGNNDDLRTRTRRPSWRVVLSESGAAHAHSRSANGRPTRARCWRERSSSAAGPLPADSWDWRCLRYAGTSRAERKPNGVASHHPSRYRHRSLRLERIGPAPRASVVPDWGLPWSMAPCSATVPISRSRAPSARARSCA